MNDVVSGAIEEIKRFLERMLPSMGADWWERRVVERLAFPQQRFIAERRITSLDGLDLAALLRVLDRNWTELAPQANLPREGRAWVQELQEVRNKWAHASSRPVPASESYRDVDTMGRLLTVLGADGRLAAIERRKAELLRELAAESNVRPAVATSIGPLSDQRTTGRATRTGSAVPKAITCTLNGNEIDVANALQMRARGASPVFRCIECGESVRPHKQGTTGQAAHFEHNSKNPLCPLSGPR